MYEILDMMANHVFVVCAQEWYPQGRGPQLLFLDDSKQNDDPRLLSIDIGKAEMHKAYENDLNSLNRREE